MSVIPGTAMTLGNNAYTELENLWVFPASEVAVFSTTQSLTGTTTAHCTQKSASFQDPQQYLN